MTRSRFELKQVFEPTATEYRLLPFRFMRWHDGTVLLTNECGEYEFVSPEDFACFAHGRLSRSARPYAGLKSKHFLDDTSSALPVELLATKVRTKRSFLSGFTRLHIFVVTLRCDHTCQYFQVSRVTEDRTRFDMSVETAHRSLEWVFQVPARELKIEFQGGEPTLNWPLIAHVVERAEARALLEGRTVEFVVTTNLSHFTGEMLAFCKEHHIHLSTSLDGPPDLHDANRPRPGRDSYLRFRRNLESARACLGHDQVAALMTTTPSALHRVREVIDEYVSLRFQTIFLRPVSPYGFAARGRLAKAYDSKRFLEFYREGLDYIIEVNREGTTLVESYAQMLLRKILTPFPVGYVDLQSPAGTAIGALVYNYDGSVYASDESRMLAEMGDYSFRLGEIGTDDYVRTMTSSRTRALVEHSCLETLPGCTECAFAPYCGADPVFNWTTQRDIVGFRPTSEFCRRQMGLFEYLFDKLRHGDAFVRRLFFAWANQ